MGESAEAATKTVPQICEEEWQAHKADCSGFLKAVAARFGLVLHGLANDIIDYVAANWSRAPDGATAAQKAAAGKFVVAGLKAQPHGHVVIVVPGPLNRGKYPTAYWGTLGGVGRKNDTINWAWDQTDRDKVGYFYTTLGGTAAGEMVASGAPPGVAGNRPQTIGGD